MRDEEVTEATYGGEVRKKKDEYEKRVKSALPQRSFDTFGRELDPRTGKVLQKEGNLHKWFKGSKSKDGKSGWVNVVTGGTCASDEPGEGTPKCVSSSKRASMSKAERKSAARRKKAADPNQQSKTGAAKPTYVSTDKPKKKMNEENNKDHEYSMARSELATIKSAADRLMKKMGSGEGQLEAWVQSKITKASDYLDTVADYIDSGEVKEEMEINEADKKGKGSGKKDACYHKVKASAKVWPSAYASGRLVQCRKKGASNYGKSKNEEFMALPEFTDLQINSMRKIGIEVEVLDEAAFKMQYGKPGKLNQSSKRKSLGRGSSIKDGAKPSGYESPSEFRSAEKKFSEDKDPCWNTHTQVGMKKKGNRMVPNCVPKGSVKEEIFEKLRQDKKDTIEEATRIPAQNGNIYMVTFMWRGKLFYLKVFFPEVSRPNRKQVEDAINKIYPGAIVKYYDLTVTQQGDSYLYAGSHEGGDGGKKSDVFAMFGEEKEKKKSCPEGQYFCNKDNKCKSIPKGYRVMSNGTLVGDEDNNEDGGGDMSEDWQSTNKKDKVDGMGKAAIRAYRRENPGSKLKGAVTGNPKKGSKDAKRRKSYCSRSKGQQDMHNIDCSKTPDKAICKARRRWKC